MRTGKFMYDGEDITMALNRCKTFFDHWHCGFSLKHQDIPDIEFAESLVTQPEDEEELLKSDQPPPYVVMVTVFPGNDTGWALVAEPDIAIKAEAPVHYVHFKRKGVEGKVDHGGIVPTCETHIMERLKDGYTIWIQEADIPAECCVCAANREDT